MTTDDAAAPEDSTEPVDPDEPGNLSEPEEIATRPKRSLPTWQAPALLALVGVIGLGAAATGVALSSTPSDNSEVGKACGQFAVASFNPAVQPKASSVKVAQVEAYAWRCTVKVTGTDPTTGAAESQTVTFVIRKRQ